VDLSAPFVVPHTQGTQVWITQFYLQITPYLPLPRKRSLDGAIINLWWRPSNCGLLIYRPQKDERLSWPSWLTYSGRFTHISGHASAVGRAQRRESSPVKDRRSTTAPRNQPNFNFNFVTTARRMPLHWEPTLVIGVSNATSRQTVDCHIMLCTSVMSKQLNRRLV